MAENTRLINGLEGLAKTLRRGTQRTLERAGKRAGGELINTIEVVLLQLFDRFVIQESHLFYGDFVISGRKKGGKKVPIDALEKFIKDRAFNVAAENIRGVAFAIQTNIFKFGIKKFDFIEETLKRVDPELVKEVEKAANENMDVAIDEIVNATDRRFKVAV